jgi:hypothetical protein
MLYWTFAGNHDYTISMMTPIGISIVTSLALLRINNIQRVFGDMKSMRKQHKKWFILYMVLQSHHAVAGLLPL